MTNKFRHVIASFDEARDIWHEQINSLVNDFRELTSCLPLQRTASILLGFRLKYAAREGNNDIFHLDTEVYGPANKKLLAALSIPDETAKRDALINLLQDQQVLDTLRLALAETASNMASQNPMWDDMATNAISKYDNLDWVLKQLMQMKPSTNPVKTFMNMFAGMIYAASGMRNKKRQRELMAPATRKSIEHDLASYADTLRASGVSEPDIKDMVSQKRKEMEPSANFAAIESPVGEDMSLSDIQGANLTGNDPEMRDPGIIVPEKDDVLSRVKILMVRMQDHLKNPRLPALLHDLQEVITSLDKIDKMNIELPDLEYEELANISRKVKNTARQLSESGEYADDVNVDQWLDSIESHINEGLMGVGSARQKSRPSAEPDEWMKNYKSMREQSRDILPNLARLIKIPQEVIDNYKGTPQADLPRNYPELLAQNKNLKSLAYAYMQDPNSPEGRMGEFLLRKIMESLDYQTMHRKSGIRMPQHYSPPGSVLHRKNEIDDIGGEDEDEDEFGNIEEPEETEIQEVTPEDISGVLSGDDFKNFTGSEEDISGFLDPMDISSLAQDVEEGEDEEYKGLPYYTKRPKKSFMEKHFLDSVRDELAQNSSYHDLGSDWASQAGQHAQDIAGRLTSVSQNFRSNVPMAVADRMRELDLGGKDWSELTDEDINRIAHLTIDSYYQAYPRGLYGFSNTKYKLPGRKNQPSPLIQPKHRSAQIHYIIDMLNRRRHYSKTGGFPDRDPTIFPDIHKHNPAVQKLVRREPQVGFEPEPNLDAEPEMEMIASVIERLVRVANILDINNCYSESSIVDLIIQKCAEE